MERSFVKPKKFLGQHFLLDEAISERIASEVLGLDKPELIVEVGAGTGALTKYLFASTQHKTIVVEVDDDSISYLRQHYPLHDSTILFQDILECNLESLAAQFSTTQKPQISVIGNFPYNISSQILFKVLEYRHMVPFVVGMFQKEVAKRISSPPGKRDYGILSVFMQTFYTVEYLFDVPPTAFNPPPNVNSGVVRFTRIEGKELSCNQEVFFRTVKTAFNQRRKTLRNALKGILPPDFPADSELLSKRAEQLSSADFEFLAGLLDKD